MIGKSHKGSENSASCAALSVKSDLNYGGNDDVSPVLIQVLYSDDNDFVLKTFETNCKLITVLTIN